MRKILDILLIFLFTFLSVKPCFAINELYYLHNANKQNVSSIIENTVTEKNYYLKKTNPFLAVSNKTPGLYSAIILQQDGNNLYYYFESNSSQKKLNKAILKNIEKKNISYYELDDKNMLTSFSKSAQNVIYGRETKYSFEEPVQKTEDIQQIKTEIKEEPAVLSGYVASVGKGKELNVYLYTPINTATATVGDRITGVLKDSWYTDENKLIAYQGSVLYGQITKAKSARAGMRNGYVQLVFNKLYTPDGKQYEINTKQIDFNVTNEGKIQQTITDVLTSSAIGAVIGLLGGLIFSGGDAGSMLSGAAIGAGFGAGGAVITSAMEKGIDAEIPARTNIEVVLTKDINVIFNE